MRVFKYRSLEQLGLAFDILFANRLYCASAETLNDPMEGSYGTMIKSSACEAEAAQKQVEEFSKRLRICSLSRTCGEHLLWAHYASGFTGLAIEVEIPEPTKYSPLVDEGLVRIKEVDCSIGSHLGTLPYDDPRAAAYERFAAKERHWAYENEVRIIGDVDGLDQGCFYHILQKPRAVYLGFRMPLSTKFSLGAICEKLGIPLAIVSPGPGQIPWLDVCFPNEMKWPGGLIELPGMPMD